MSITKTISPAPSPIIPVTDEQIKVLPGIPKAQQAKISVYNELLEEIYIRRTELEGLDGHLAAMKREIEDDLAHLAFKNAEEATLKAKKRRSGVALFIPSGRSPSPVNGTEQDGGASPKTNSNPNAAANVISAAIANMKSVAGTTRNVKSKGKGKGKQKFTKINLDDGHYDYSRDDYGYAEDEESEDEESEDEESEDEESEDDGEDSLIPASFN